MGMCMFIRLVDSFYIDVFVVLIEVFDWYWWYDGNDLMREVVFVEVLNK